MQDTFWTDELVMEFVNSYYGHVPEDIVKFKASKAPKKEWEIVAYSFKPLSGKISREPIIGPNSKYWQQAQQDSEDYTIHSVRRLSDNLIFSCQDTVDTPNNGRLVIEGFEIDGADMLVKIGGGYLGFSAIKKLPQPILVTHDGVEIFEGDEFWGVRDWRVLEGGKADKYDKNLDKAAPVFSTRSAAEEYILNHKPVLSLNDVREAMPRYMSPGEVKAVTDKLTVLVKEKINQ